jgi:hypothetical protein
VNQSIHTKTRSTSSSMLQVEPTLGVLQLTRQQPCSTTPYSSTLTPTRPTRTNHSTSPHSTIHSGSYCRWHTNNMQPHSAVSSLWLFPSLHVLSLPVSTFHYPSSPTGQTCLTCATSLHSTMHSRYHRPTRTICKTSQRRIFSLHLSFLMHAESLLASTFHRWWNDEG